MDCLATIDKKVFLLFAHMNDMNCGFDILPLEVIVEIFSYVVFSRNMLSNPFVYTRGWGEREGSNQKLGNTRGLAYDHILKRVLVSDSTHSVYIFSDKGPLIKKFGEFGNSDGCFNFPTGIAIAPKTHNIYVCDPSNSRVQIFNSTGQYLDRLKSTNFSCPFDITISKQNFIYITDYRNNQVQVYNNTNQHIFHFGLYGSSPGQFAHPRGIATSKNSDKLYVCDSVNARVQVFTKKGGFLFSFGDSGPKRLVTAGGVDVDDCDNVYVTDCGAHKAVIFNSFGKYLMEIGALGSPSGAMKQPFDINVNENARVLVSDNGNNRVQMYI
eukprot:TRINITY_DN8431_c0_g1_i1.p1 TRINITY_DN8431_c0_g1~~TRINITY_DN8431_c0_g1_i1.p1  ORF type:complete len:326 (-),score=41.82 TRINITY_DN8431_c0_g1_i1:49-1026(-)